MKSVTQVLLACGNRRCRLLGPVGRRWRGSLASRPNGAGTAAETAVAGGRAQTAAIAIIGAATSACRRCIIPKDIVGSATTVRRTISAHSRQGQRRRGGIGARCLASLGRQSPTNGRPRRRGGSRGTVVGGNGWQAHGSLLGLGLSFFVNRLGARLSPGSKEAGSAVAPRTTDGSSTRRRVRR